MNHRIKFRALLAMALATLMLTVCGAGVLPAKEMPGDDPLAGIMAENDFRLPIRFSRK